MAIRGFTRPRSKHRPRDWFRTEAVPDTAKGRVLGGFSKTKLGKLGFSCARKAKSERKKRKTEVFLDLSTPSICCWMTVWVYWSERDSTEKSGGVDF